MIDILFFSIANKKKNDVIDLMLSELLMADYISPQDKKILAYTVQVASQGQYPNRDYYQQYYNQSKVTTSISELKLLFLQIKDFYQREDTVKKVFNVINGTVTNRELINQISSIATTNLPKEDEEDEDSRPSTYSANKKGDTTGLITGVGELDREIGTIQLGTIASVAAFVAEGKTTFVNSMIYKNVKKGKKGVLFSLEMHPSLLWMQFQARYLFEEHSIEIKASELIKRSLTDEKAKLIEKHDQEFKDFFNTNLLIKSESVLSKEILFNPDLFTALLRRYEGILGGLDFIAFDHVNQLELMFPGSGNQIIKTIQSVVKNYHNNENKPLAGIFAVQTNREGWRRARKREGKYDLLAISELNEVERSSTYIIFMYTSEDMRITQETKITLMKHRLGSVIQEPIVTTFNPSVLLVGDLMEKIEYEDDFGVLAGGFDDDDFGI